mmetsp:Transcript_3879/g.13718  ORF Transcript_3879/g.13718 Transcript_3879/m.13718 type:complete len:301 (-) Transcript_3879:548-1450(-)
MAPLVRSSAADSCPGKGCDSSRRPESCSAKSAAAWPAAGEAAAVPDGAPRAGDGWADGWAAAWAPAAACSATMASSSSSSSSKSTSLSAAGEAMASWTVCWCSMASWSSSMASSMSSTDVPERTHFSVAVPALTASCTWRSDSAVEMAVVRSSNVCTTCSCLAWASWCSFILRMCMIAAFWSPLLLHSSAFRLHSWVFSLRVASRRREEARAALTVRTSASCSLTATGASALAENNAMPAASHPFLCLSPCALPGPTLAPRASPFIPLTCRRSPSTANCARRTSSGALSSPGASRAPTRS